MEEEEEEEEEEGGGGYWAGVFVERGLRGLRRLGRLDGLAVRGVRRVRELGGVGLEGCWWFAPVLSPCRSGLLPSALSSFSSQQCICSYQCDD